MTPHIILIMQIKDFEPISILEDLCVVNEDGNVAVFPDFESAKAYQDENCIDGKIIKVPTY